jgi:septal ring factor EnvC (AmiA/AmiB activator)
MTRLIPILAATLIAGVVIAQTQPGRPDQSRQSRQSGPAMEAGRGNMQQMREMQMKALTALQQDMTKLRASLDAAMPSNMQNMSEDERNRMREKMTQSRDEQQKIIADMEAQMTLLKGRGQMQTEHDQAIAQLQAIQNQAKQENATKTSDMIAKMIQEKQTRHDQMMQKMGGAGTGAGGMGTQP